MNNRVSLTQPAPSGKTERLFYKYFTNPGHTALKFFIAGNGADILKIGLIFA